MLQDTSAGITSITHSFPTRYSMSRTTVHHHVMSEISKKLTDCFVCISSPPCNEDCACPHDRKVQQHGHSNPKHITYLVDDIVPLQPKKHNDCVNECKQSYWPKVGHKPVKPLLAKNSNNQVPSYNPCYQRCTKEDQDAASHLPETNVQGVIMVGLARSLPWS